MSSSQALNNYENNVKENQLYTTKRFLMRLNSEGEPLYEDCIIYVYRKFIHSNGKHGVNYMLYRPNENRWSRDTRRFAYVEDEPYFFENIRELNDIDNVNMDFIDEVTRNNRGGKRKNKKTNKKNKQNKSNRNKKSKRSKNLKK